jgi:hypothetical protein
MTLSAAEANYNAARAGQVRETLVWLRPRDRVTGARVDVGFWTGRDDRSFVINGQTRSYFGAGAALDCDDIPGGVGLDVRYISVRLGVVDEVEQAIRGYDAKLAPVEIHTAAFDLATRALIAGPRRIFLGTVNESPIPTPVEGGGAEIELRLASAARALTRTVPLFKSDAEMRRRNPTDRFREYVSTAGIRQVAWGEDRVQND